MNCPHSRNHVFGLNGSCQFCGFSPTGTAALGEINKELATIDRSFLMELTKKNLDCNDLAKELLEQAKKLEDMIKSLDQEAQRAMFFVGGQYVLKDWQEFLKSKGLE